MKAIVDRIDGGIAVLILCENNETIIKLPHFLLPGAGEGDCVNILVTMDGVGTKKAREKSRKMVETIK